MRTDQALLDGIAERRAEIEELRNRVFQRALIERRRALEDHVPEGLWPAMSVTEKEWNAWVTQYHAPFALGLSLTIAELSDKPLHDKLKRLAGEQ